MAYMGNWNMRQGKGSAVLEIPEVPADKLVQHCAKLSKDAGLDLKMNVPG